MEPVPASRRVDDEYGPFSYDDADLLQDLIEKSARIQTLVPQCVGLSFALLADGVTFTLVAPGVQPVFGSAAEAAGVQSTLTFPLTREGQLLGLFNLYATSRDSFEGHHEAIGMVLGVRPAAATRDDDLGFSTHALALRAPQIMRDETNLAVAVAMLCRWRGLEAEQAEARLRRASQRVGISVEVMVAALLEVLIEQAPTGGDDWPAPA